jgi:dipeptidyl aminopeptidase/acylaminoacyl peptidase
MIISVILRVFVCTLLLLCFTLCWSQKPSLDLEAVQHFPTLTNISAISGDGAYVYYVVNNNDSQKTATLFIRSLTDHYIREVTGLPMYFSNIQFSLDADKLLFLVADTLYILDLKTRKQKYIAGCMSFDVGGKGHNTWLAVHLENDEFQLVNLHSGAVQQFSGVVNFLLASSGKTLILKSKTTSGVQLQWVNPCNKQTVNIWKGYRAEEFVVDHQESQLAFTTTDTLSRKSETSIWLYKHGQRQAKCIVDDCRIQDSGLSVSASGLEFSTNGDKLFFNCNSRFQTRVSSTVSANVDIWNYKDQFLQSEQLLKTSQPIPLTAVHLSTGRIIILKSISDVSLSIINKAKNSDQLLTFNSVNSWEEYRRADQRPDVVIVNCLDGKRKTIIHKKQQILSAGLNFSPAGNYVYWYDVQTRGFYTYELGREKTVNVSTRLNVPLFQETSDYIRKPDPYSRSVSWQEDDESMLVYDQYDIWKLDPKGIKPPINITNGFGRKNKIVFRLIEDNNMSSNFSVSKQSDIVVCAFDETTKANGFFRTSLSGGKQPVQLAMSNSVYYFPSNFSFAQFSTFIRKAQNKSVCLLMHESATESPNYVVTSDFKSFVKITDINPQRKFNWLTSELVRYTTSSGKESTGILYKPENFDSAKKYPVIVYVYERYADAVHKFVPAELAYAAINIPLMVSSGYVVFLPDIQYTTGQPGESVYEFVMSGVEKIKKELWVDAARLGIQGHSFGGYEVNYLITRTKQFAAAASGAGDVNLISAAGDILKGGSDNHAYVEFGQYRMKDHLWQNPESYIKNSPIFFLDKVTTPLLIMHNKNDAAVNWAQAIELFTGLRRLGKKVWMLQYDGEGHLLYNPANQYDFSLRIQQYFDHYLKGAPPPVWMTTGVPAVYKSINTGLQYDSTGATP